MRESRRRSIYRRKYEKPTDANILRLLMPSILGMLLCMVCLAGMTWAWFTATSDTSVAIVQSAEFHTNVVITTQGEKAILGNDDAYSIDPNTIYAVTLTATGSTENGGYIAVSVDGDTYYTEHMEQDEKISFTVCSEDGEIGIVSSWNSFDSEISTFSSNANSHRILRDGAFIGRGEVPSEEPKEKEQVEQTDPEKSEQPTQSETPEQEEKTDEPTTPDSSNDPQTSTSGNNSGSTGNVDNSADSDNSAENAGLDNGTSTASGDNAETN